MKKALIIIITTAMMLCGCAHAAAPAQIAATTLPVYEFTARLCEDTPLTVARLVTEEVSCLHDYSLNVNQVKAAEAAELIVCSGAGLEEFLDDILLNAQIIDASTGIELLAAEGHHHDHSHGHEEGNHTEEAHHHEQDPHIWLSPANARDMAFNIWEGLCSAYPEHTERFTENLWCLSDELDALALYGHQQLKDLSCRELITFHDGFAYLADAFELTILDAIEEESGSEASAGELIHMIEEVEHHDLPAIFTEKSGSVSAAGIIARETGATAYVLDMAMAGDSYFDAMYRNIDTLKEALQ